MLWNLGGESKQRQGVGSVGWDDGGVGQEETVKAAVSSLETAMVDGSDDWHYTGCY